MSAFQIILVTLIIYSIVATLAYVISNEKEEVAMAFGLGVVGLALIGIASIIHKVKNKFKYHIGKRSIFIEEATGTKYKCRVKDAEDIRCWDKCYKMIKRYAKKSEWLYIQDFSKEFIENSKRNCDHCKYNNDCIYDYPRNTVKCKNDYGTVIEFNKFEKR